MGLSLGIGLGITHARAKAAVSSGSPFSLTIPVAGSFQLTAAGNATGVTAEAWGKGDGVTKGDYCKTLNVSVNSGDSLAAGVGSDYSYLQTSPAGVLIVQACANTSSGNANVGDTQTLHGGNLNTGQVKLAGTTAASGLAFTCPNLIMSVTDSGSGPAKFATLGAHGLKISDSITIAGLSVGSYNGVKTVLSVPTTSTFTADPDYVSDVGGVTGVACGSWS